MKNVTDEQEILEAISSGENVFVTGSAGSGKTYLASQYARGRGDTVLTATTGVAALNLGGETIHRFLGLGVATRDFQASKIINKWMSIKKSSKPWDKDRWRLIQKIRTIIIDEVSMLRRDQFELIDIILSAIRDNPLPFGGVQMILVGDFFQLPPVVTSSEAMKYTDLQSPFCFQSPLWSQARFKAFNLKTNYRQGEGEFLDALEQIRVGNLTDEIRDMLQSRLGIDLNIPIEPVKLFAHKETVSAENIACLKKLPGDKLVSTADFTGKEYHVKILEKECPAETDLYFGKDAQVMMLTNEPTGLWVNGTMGIIKNTSPLEIRLSSGVTVGVGLHTWEKIEHKVMPNGTVSAQTVATMSQYPFKLAYSSTIHKSQGLTLDYIDIDLNNCFAPGQAYVALSRAKTLEGLRLRAWNKASIKADNKVKIFYGVD